MCFILFGCIWCRLVALQNSVQNGPKCCKSSCHEVVSELFATNSPDPPHWTLNSCLIAFQTILVLLGPFGCVTTHSAKLVRMFVPRSHIGIFLKNAPDPPHWTLNSYFGVFCTIRMHLEPFRCLTKLSANRAELVQKFVPRSRVSSLRNTPDWPRWDLNSYFGAFRTTWVHLGTVWLPYKTRCKTGRTSAKVRATKSCRNFPQRTHPIHPIGP